MEILNFLKEHLDFTRIALILMAFHTFMKALRDALDKTPETDDNFFEKAVTVAGKLLNYFFTGKRP